jgi:lipopolysaccharide export LptBFGC system permease protein LptF
VEEKKDNGKGEIYSKKIRAGKRTYFFDVKPTKSNDFYLTITESKKRLRDDTYVFEKHKIFLYKEDFDKFVETLQETVNHIKSELMPEIDFSQFKNNNNTNSEEKTTNQENNSNGSSDLKWD